MLLDWKTPHSKCVDFLQTDMHVHVSPTQVPVGFFVDIYKIILIFIWKGKIIKIVWQAE